jgi:hypothetical protein
MKSELIGKMVINQLMLFGAIATTRENQTKILEFLSKKLSGLSEDDQQFLSYVCRENETDTKLLRESLEELRLLLVGK